MKKIVALLPMFLLANNLMMPPMPPSMNLNEHPKHQLKSRPDTKKKNVFPKECQTVPPMLIFMPPPLEKDLSTCKNKLFMPKKEIAQKKLKLKIKKIEIVNGFNELYKITTDKKTIYCNKDLTKCLEVKKWIKK